MCRLPIDKNELDICCGCGACTQICSQTAITMQFDEEGFEYPRIDQEKCVDCNSCIEVCPVIKKQPPKDAKSALVAFNNNEEEREVSSSGGIFVSVAKKIIFGGGCVSGAVFDKDWMVIHSIAYDVQNVKLQCGSKYVQSKAYIVYKRIEELLKENKTVLFTGTPCQVQGLKLFLGKEYENLYTMDFICHGVPSPGVWEYYLRSLQDKKGTKNIITNDFNNVPSIKKIAFRDKSKGWKKYRFALEFANNSTDFEKKLGLSSIYYKNPFVRSFIWNMNLRPSCGNCPSKCGKSGSDITLADCWGIETLCPNFDDDKGTSMVFLNTDKGQQLFSSIEDLSYKIVSFDDCVKRNPSWMENAQFNVKRHEFFKGYCKSDNFHEFVYHLTDGSRLNRVYSLFKRGVKKVLKIFDLCE